MSGNRITLKLDSKEVPLAQFKSMVTSFFELIEAVGREAAEDNKLKWTVAVRAGSQVVEAFAKSDDQALVDKVVNIAIPNGLRLLEKGADTAPEYFSSKAIAAARRLSSQRTTSKNVIPITIHAGKKQTAITAKTLASADDLIGRASQSYGTIEGRLRTISDAEGGVRFVIQQRLFKRNISCNIQDSLIEGALAAFRKRVVVSGMIQYNKKGTPLSMEVSKLETMPENDALPSLDEVCGILAG